MQVAHFDDLHAEFSDFEPQSVAGIDLITLGGDIGAGVKRTADVIRRFRERNPGIPIALVLGNHDFYGMSLESAVDDHRRELAVFDDVFLLENDSVMIGNTLVVGATLWTDLSAEGVGYVAQVVMNDFRKIRIANRTKRLEPGHVTFAHRKSVRYITERLAAHTGQALVLTHHAPTALSWTPRRDTGEWITDDMVRNFYCAALDDLIASTQPAAWLHGHVHATCDYRIGHTRIANNARGYVDDDNAGEDSFVPTGLIVEV